MTRSEKGQTTTSSTLLAVLTCITILACCLLGCSVESGTNTSRVPEKSAQLSAIAHQVEARNYEANKNVPEGGNPTYMECTATDSAVLIDVHPTYGQDRQLVLDASQYPLVSMHVPEEDGEAMMYTLYTLYLVLEDLNNESPIANYDRYQEKVYRGDASIETPGFDIVEGDGYTFVLDLAQLTST